MQNSLNINEEESIIYPTFRDERIQSIINTQYDSSIYSHILSSTINYINNLKEIIILLLNKNKNIQNNENELIKITSEYNININSFLIYLFFL